MEYVNCNWRPQVFHNSAEPGLSFCFAVVLDPRPLLFSIPKPRLQKEKKKIPIPNVTKKALEKNIPG
jgi:hypothetical protein